MAGTTNYQNFEIFNDKAKIDKENMISTPKVKSISNKSVRSLSSNEQSQNKQKGLSILSESDLNVFFARSNNSKTKINLDVENKGIILKNKKILSPVRIKTFKNSAFTSFASKKLSPKILSPIRQNVADDLNNNNKNKSRSLEDLKNLEQNFRACNQSLSVKKSNSNYYKDVTSFDNNFTKANEYPEPENLAYDCNYNQLMIEEITRNFKSDQMWMKPLLITDETADESMIFYSDKPILQTQKNDEDYPYLAYFDVQSPELSNVELPEVSDSDESIA